LLLLSPLFLLAALAVKWDDGGPVLYAQDRVGKNFRSFRLLKFRSMAPGSERSGVLTAPSDSRITRVGRVLRKYKLDELPQLWNVLQGDMQLVGPRPEVARYVERFRERYAILLRQPPGITDPASLAYRHEEQCFQAGAIEQQYLARILPDKLRLSLEYQRRRNFFSDLAILLHTVAGLIPFAKLFRRHNPAPADARTMPSARH